MQMSTMVMLGATALVFASPVTAADLSVVPYGGPGYQRETHTYEYRTEPPAVVVQPAPIAEETVIVRRPIVVAPPRVVVEDYPIYTDPLPPSAFAYTGPVWRDEWRHRHFRGGW
jgi:hypothetical protein